MSIKQLKRERLLMVSNIIVMTITFLIFGIFITLVAMSQTAIRTLEKQAQITLFFKDEFTEQSILDLQTQLEQDNRISGTRYVSKEEALRIFTELNKDDPILLESVSANILPASLEIRTKDISDLSAYAEELTQLEGVEEVKFFKDVVDTFQRWSTISYIVGFTLVAAFLIISFSVVIVTLRITISSKGQELEILKLVGASDDYVKKPLITQGVFFGVVSSLLASVILLIVTILVTLAGIFSRGYEFPFLPDVYINTFAFSLTVSFILVVSGFMLGYFGSLAAIKRYLKY